MCSQFIILEDTTSNPNIWWLTTTPSNLHLKVLVHYIASIAADSKPLSSLPMQPSVNIASYSHIPLTFFFLDAIGMVSSSTLFDRKKRRDGETLLSLDWLRPDIYERDMPSQIPRENIQSLYMSISMAPAALFWAPKPPTRRSWCWCHDAIYCYTDDVIFETRRNKNPDFVETEPRFSWNSREFIH